MTQPTRQHRREIKASLMVSQSYGVVSDILWRNAIAAKQHVGVCSDCGQPMIGHEPEERGGRMFYLAECVMCRREVTGMGPRLPKKGAKP